MVNNHNKYDEFIKKLIRKKGLEKAPDDFTAGVMNRIEAKTEGSLSLFSPLTWVLAGAGLAAVIIVLFMFDIPYVNDIFSATHLSSIQFNKIISADFINSFISFFEGIKLGPISLIIGLTAIALVALDRFLRIWQTYRNINFFV